MKAYVLELARRPTPLRHVDERRFVSDENWRLAIVVVIAAALGWLVGVGFGWSRGFDAGAQAARNYAEHFGR